MTPVEFVLSIMVVLLLSVIVWVEVRTGPDVRKALEAQQETFVRIITNVQTRHAEEIWGRSYTRGIDFLQGRQPVVEALEKPLMMTGRFVEVTHVPSNLLPEEPSIQRMREVAALMQAHLLVVLETGSELVTYHGGLFSKDEVEAMAMIELFVMDVRTGAIPYARTHQGVDTTKEIGDDWTIEQTQRRAERQATLRVVTEAAEGLAAFFKP